MEKPGLKQAPKNPGQQIADRLNDLIEGKVKPPNPFVGYMIQKFTEARAAHIALQNNIQQGEQQLTAMKAEAQKLQGVIQNYIEDIRAWDKKSVEGEKVPEVPSDNAVSDAKA